MNECVSFLQSLGKALSDLIPFLSNLMNLGYGVMIFMLTAATENAKQKLQDSIQRFWKTFQNIIRGIWKTVQIYWSEAKKPLISEPKNQLGIVLLGCLAIATAVLSLLTPIVGISYIFCPLLKGATYDWKFKMYTIFIVFWTVMSCSYYFRQFIATLRHGNVRPILWEQ
jgi:uncharacterized membrane protein YqjE